MSDIITSATTRLAAFDLPRAIMDRIGEDAVRIRNLEHQAESLVADLARATEQAHAHREEIIAWQTATGVGEPRLVTSGAEALAETQRAYAQACRDASEERKRAEAAEVKLADVEAAWRQATHCDTPEAVYKAIADDVVRDRTVAAKLAAAESRLAALTAPEDDPSKTEAAMRAAWDDIAPGAWTLRADYARSADIRSAIARVVTARVRAAEVEPLRAERDAAFAARDAALAVAEKADALRDKMMGERDDARTEASRLTARVAEIGGLASLLDGACQDRDALKRAIFGDGRPPELLRVELLVPMAEQARTEAARAARLTAALPAPPFDLPTLVWADAAGGFLAHAGAVEPGCCFSGHPIVSAGACDDGAWRVEFRGRAADAPTAKTTIERAVALLTGRAVAERPAPIAADVERLADERPKLGSALACVDNAIGSLVHVHDSVGARVLRDDPAVRNQIRNAWRWVRAVVVAACQPGARTDHALPVAAPVLGEPLSDDALRHIASAKPSVAANNVSRLPGDVWIGKTGPVAAPVDRGGLARELYAARYADTPARPLLSHSPGIIAGWLRVADAAIARLTGAEQPAATPPPLTVEMLVDADIAAHPSRGEAKETADV